MDRLNAFLSIYKIPLALSLVGLVLIIGGIYTNQPVKAKAFPAASLVKPTDTPPNQLKINISGAVNNPGVYSMNLGDRVEDAIKAAGGFSDDANPEYISKVLNLSLKISDGQKIYLPFANEKAPVVMMAASNSSPQTTTSGLIGLNTGTPAQLDSLPGVGPVTSQKIITARPYTDINELFSRKVVSKSVFEKIQPLVDLN